MKKYQIHLEDVGRIIFGEVPASFYLEVVIRVAIIYLVLMVSMRLMGKRMSSQLNVNELAAMVTLAAAIGVPIQAPDRGIIPAVIIALIVVFTERWISARAFKNQKFEQVSQGDISTLVENSVMKLEAMKQVRISRERLFAQLRSEGVTNLGQVKRMYIEAGGSFSLVQEPEEKPGLSVLPDKDPEFRNQQMKEPSVMLCYNCGKVKDADVCSNCGGNEWMAGVKG